MMVQCPGCKATCEKNSDNSPHRYGVAAPECWIAFNELLSFERNTWGYPPAHRLMVDAYSVQHPPNLALQKKLNISERFIDASIQSIAIHLIALHFAIVEKVDLVSISKKMDILRRFEFGKGGAKKSPRMQGRRRARLHRVAGGG